MSDNKELLPCPHCGKVEPVRICRASEDEDFGGDNDETFAVVCDASSYGGIGPGGCGAVGGYHRKEVDAIAGWNRRAAQPVVLSDERVSKLIKLCVDTCLISGVISKADAIAILAAKEQANGI